MERCGRPRKRDRLPCQQRVKSPGIACWRHGDSDVPAVVTRPAPRPKTSAPTRRSSPSSSSLGTQASTAPTPSPSHRAQERKRVEEAAKFCADLLPGGWEEAVAERITDYGGSAWQRLKRSHRKRNCKTLARIARSILEAKGQIHKAIGRVFGEAAGAMGGGDAARAFAEELASKIPIGPVDAKMVAVARGVQAAGILLCVMDDRELTQCQCFIDLALAETKERVQRILVAAMSDWTNLARFPARKSR